MSKLFKSKFLMGVMVVAVLVVGGLAVKAEQASADCSITMTLRIGSTGTEVQCLQGKLGVAADGKFGPMTNAAVKAFQAGKGLSADGVVGPMTRAALMGANPVVSNGCQSGWAFNPATGQPCTGGSTTPPAGDLEGGAGDADITKTTTDVEDSVKEGEDDVQVLGFEVDPSGSDVEVTSVKVTLKNTSYASSSERLERYVDSVGIFMDGDEVGSVDVEDFDRNTGTPDEYTATIQLSDAVVQEDEDTKFYVTVSGASTIDSDDITNADWNVVLDTVRFNDATGAILTADLPSSLDTTGETFTFEEAGVDDDLSVKSSSANPDDMSVKVDENDNSDEVLALAYKLEVDEDSSDVTIFDLPVEITVNENGSMATNIDDIIDSVVVKVGSDEWTADLEDSDDGDFNTPGASQTFNYVLDLDDGDLMIESGETVDVKVYITFKDQDDNYGIGTTVVAALDASDIEAEGEDDDITGITGDRTGGILTLNTSVASVSNVDWDVTSTGTIIDFLFTVSAEDDDVDVLLADITSNDTVSGTATVASPTLTKISGDADAISGGYSVAEGDTARFRVRYAVSGTNGQYANVTITSVAGQDVADDDQVSPTAVLNVQ